jgi:rhomboid protease GluP
LTGPTQPARSFTVRYSDGEPRKDRRNSFNSFGLHGEGRLLVDDDFLVFADSSGNPDRAPRIPRPQVANVDYNPEKSGFVIRTLKGDQFIVLWTSSREDADALWALLPQEKTPEFLAERAQIERFDQAMEKLGSRAPVTPAIIGLNAAVFFVMLFLGADILRPPGELLVQLGSNYGPLTWSGDYWRLLTSAFLHGGIIHIALNMFALYQGGNLVERLYGSGRFTLLYLLSAIAGSVASGWWDPARNSVGASGAIFGVFGALLVFFALRREDFPAQLWKQIGGSALIFCGYSLVVGAASPIIDNAAHVGGLLGGVVSGFILARPFSIEARAKPQPWRLVLAALAVLLPLLWLTRPLLDADEATRRGFALMLHDFEAADMQSRVRQAEIIGQRREGEGSEMLARRFRDEVLVPWREVAKPVLEARDLPVKGSLEADLQPVIREYIRAKDRALSLTVLALQTGDPDAFESAQLAWQRVGQAVRKLGTDRNPGT